jgi:outer membrane receptor for ferrienterochelin and colicin
MRYFFFFFSLILFSSEADAQTTGTVKGKISGRIKDAATKLPVEYATIALCKQGSTSPLTSTASDSKGSFAINNISNGEYLIYVDFLGYQRAIVEHLTISNTAKSITLNNIVLSANQKTLKDVNITAQAGTVENKIDKMVYNTANDLTAQGGVATDILKKVPMVTVDIDGNVELLGNPSVKFLINGKPSSIFGASLSDALQSIPASQIKSIEVITSPGAKYDASGTAGIINIILKDNKVEGYNGSINASVGTRLENTSINLNARKKNFGVNLFFSGNKTLRSQTLSTRTRASTSKDTTQNQLQNGYGNLERNGAQTGMNIDWNLGKHDDLNAGIAYHYFSNYNDGLTNQEDQSVKTGFAPFSDLLSLRNSNSTFGEKAVDVHLEYKKTFKKEGQELDASYSTSFNNNNGDYYQKLDYVNNAVPSSGSTGSNPGRDHESEIALDYTYPFTDDFTIETGAKTELETINSTSIINPFNTGTGTFIYDPNQSNSFKYSRNVYAYYVSATFKLFNFFDVKAGLRDEYTTTGVDFAGANIPDYNFLSPSIVFQHKLTKTQTIKLSYSKRIERPDFGDLNPFVNSADPYNISYGNPNLHPEIGNNFELGYNHSYDGGGNINLTTFYRHNGFDVKPFTTFYDSLQVAGKEYKNVYVTSRANVGAEVRIGVNLSGSIPITKSFTIRPNILIATRRIMDNLPNTPTLVTGLEYRSNINASYQFKHDLAAEAFVNYDGPRVGLQGTNTSFAAYSFALRKQFWDKKASLGFTTTVPFNAYVNQSSTITSSNSYQYSLRQVPFRSFGIAFSYKFGKLEFKKDKEEDNGPQIPADQ